jgi:hypothetical protein
MKNRGQLMIEARLALASHPQCGAKSKRSQRPCRCPAMANGRCYMHGGRATGGPVKHGWFTKKAIEDRRAVRCVLSELNSMLAWSCGDASPQTASRKT